MPLPGVPGGGITSPSGPRGGYDPRTDTYTPPVPGFLDRIVNGLMEMCASQTCPACSPPAGEKFNKVTHWASHSRDPNSGSHGCELQTGSPVHWHYSVNRQNPKTCQCFTAEHEFGGCGIAPP